MTLTGTKAAVALLLVQTAIALSVAGKYALDRATKPRVWVRAQQFDPSTPLRGRYLALRLTVDGCSLPASDVAPANSYDFRTAAAKGQKIDTWPAALKAENGHLAAHAVASPAADAVQSVSMRGSQDCHAATLDQSVDFFLPEHAASPLPKTPDAALWVEVTVPSTGPARPIQLAVSDQSGWHVLKQ